MNTTAAPLPEKQNPTIADYDNYLRNHHFIEVEFAVGTKVEFAQRVCEVIDDGLSDGDVEPSLSINLNLPPTPSEKNLSATVAVAVDSHDAENLTVAFSKIIWLLKEQGCLGSCQIKKTFQQRLLIEKI